MIRIVAYLLRNLGGLLLGLVGPIIAKVLVALGITFFTLTGINSLKNYALNTIAKQLTGVPADMLALIGMVKLDVFITLSLSGLVSAWVFKSANKIMFK